MEIPLFPLPDLVLFPQVAVPLHIFEERYKLMINRCIDQEAVFGLVLLQRDAEDAPQQESESTIHRVGVTARVVQVERIEDGRMNILCTGESRFRIEEFTASTPYWTGIVEFFEDDPEPEAALTEAYDEVARLYRQAMELTSRLKEARIPELDFPASPVGLSYMVSYILDLDAERKQELLVTTSTIVRLHSLSVDLERTISHLRGQLERKGLAAKVKTNGDLGKPH
jgi:ATP-dependent Lon protease